MMGLLSTTIGQILLVAVIFGVLGGFFRKMLVPIVLFLAAEIALFVLSPGLLLSFVNLVSRVREAFR